MPATGTSPLPSFLPSFLLVVVALLHHAGQQREQQQGQGTDDRDDGTVASQWNLSAVELQMIAAMSLAGVAVARLDALLVCLGGAEAATLEGSIGQTLTVADVALVAQTIQWAHLHLGMDVSGAGGVGRVAGALQALGAMQWEDLAIAAGHEAANLALQLVGACIIGGGVQIAGAAADRVSVYKEHERKLVSNICISDQLLLT